MSIRRTIVKAAIDEVKKEGLEETVTLKATEVLDFVGGLDIDIPTAIVTLDFVLFMLCKGALDHGYVEMSLKNVN